MPSYALSASSLRGTTTATTAGEALIQMMMMMMQKQGRTQYSKLGRRMVPQLSNR